MTMDTPQAGIERAIDFFEQLQPTDLSRMGDIYATQARFKDPFNDVQGVAAITRIFAHMFEQLNEPRFVVTQRVVHDTQCFVTWDFLFSSPSVQQGAPQCIRGATHFQLTLENGLWRISLHRDYWDAAEELYEKLPLIGPVLRWLKRRMA